MKFRAPKTSTPLWLVGVLVFGALNFIYSPVLAATVGVTALLGGVTTCAVAYLLSERILRATTARALSYGAPSRPVLPGVRTRGMLGWALGSGVPLVGLGLVAVATVSGDEVTDDELAIVIFALGGLALTVGLYITWLTTRAVADPVLSVRRALAKVEQGELDVEVPVYDGSELGLLQAGFNRMVAGLSERERMRDLFGRHVGEDVAHAALEQDIELGGEVREVAVLFVDIVGSTKLAGERPRAWWSPRCPRTAPPPRAPHRPARCPARAPRGPRPRPRGGRTGRASAHARSARPPCG